MTALDAELHEAITEALDEEPKTIRKFVLEEYSHIYVDQNRARLQPIKGKVKGQLIIVINL